MCSLNWWSFQIIYFFLFAFSGYSHSKPSYIVFVWPFLLSSVWEVLRVFEEWLLFRWTKMIYLNKTPKISRFNNWLKFYFVNAINIYSFIHDHELKLHLAPMSHVYLHLSVFLVIRWPVARLSKTWTLVKYLRLELILLVSLVLVYFLHLMIPLGLGFEPNSFYLFFGILVKKDRHRHYRSVERSHRWALHRRLEHFH